MYDPIAYTYDADYHCESCAEKRFGRCAIHGELACSATGNYGMPDATPHDPAEDSEGNPVGVVPPWDEWWEPSEGCQTLACGTCHALIETTHREGCENNLGEDVCDLPLEAQA
jgi:hypothetical protein